MRRALILLISLFMVGSLIWMGVHGRWESAYVTDGRRHLMDLDPTPLWSRPHPPSRSDFEAHFQNSTLPDGGDIVVYREWQEWMVRLLLLWLAGFLVATPILLFAFRHDPVLGVFARVGTGFIASALVCVLTWLAVGGWGPPSPVLFGTLGLLGGGLWAAFFANG